MNNQVNLPHWARKPNHKKEVVATPLGWMVKETGEYLKMVRNLDTRLRELNNEIVESLAALDDANEITNDTSNTQAQVEPVVTADVATVPTTDDVPPVVEEPKKRRGRPRKSATTSTK